MFMMLFLSVVPHEFSVKEAGAQLRGELANGHYGLALKTCLLEFLSENSEGRESTASQRITHTGDRSR